MENTITAEETKPAAKTTEQPKQETKPAAAQQPKQKTDQEEPKKAEEVKPEPQVQPETSSAPEATEPQAQPEITQPAAEIEEKGEKKSGFFGKFFHKKTEPGQPAATETPVETIQETPAETEVKKDFSDASIEIEKIKVMIDAIREQKTGLDESIRTIFENIGEIRSMSIQNDATASELNTKITKMDDEISQVRPKEIDKKFREMDEKLEKYDATIEKIQTKANDMADRINKAYELLRGIGGIENLIKINEDVQKKLTDIKEATHYVERLGSKSERIFIDIKAGLDDLVVYKAKQESLEESIKDLIKNIDSLSGKLETYETKKDAEALNTAISVLQKEVENINKVMTVAQANIPEPIFSLRKQRDDIMLFIESLEMQQKSGKVKTADYQEIRIKNLEKLQKIEEELEKKWK
jgi:chromosome segregation ATPase